VVEQNRKECEYFVTAFLLKYEIYIAIFLKHLYVVYGLAARLLNNSSVLESRQWLKVKQKFSKNSYE